MRVAATGNGWRKQIVEVIRWSYMPFANQNVQYNGAKGSRFLHGTRIARMPVTVHPESDAFKTLNDEGVWIIPSSDPSARLKPHLKIGLMNLMPIKPPTETQIFRMMGRAPVHVDLTLFVPDSYAAKNTSPEYLAKFYKRWSDIKSEKFDGFIMTGAPIETLPFEEVCTNIICLAIQNSYGAEFFTLAELPTPQLCLG